MFKEVGISSFTAVISQLIENKHKYRKYLYVGKTYFYQNKLYILVLILGYKLYKDFFFISYKLFNNPLNDFMNTDCVYLNIYNDLFLFLLFFEIIIYHNICPYYVERIYLAIEELTV